MFYDWKYHVHVRRVLIFNDGSDAESLDIGSDAVAMLMLCNVLLKKKRSLIPSIRSLCLSGILRKNIGLGQPSINLSLHCLARRRCQSQLVIEKLINSTYLKL